MRVFFLLIVLTSGVTCTAFGQVAGDVVYGQSKPSYPGGMDSLYRFISKNLKWPHQTPEVEGKVFVGFTVTVDGSVSDLRIIKGLCETCDRNSLEVFSKMPKWLPATENGKPIKSEMVIPIYFKLN